MDRKYSGCITEKEHHNPLWMSVIVVVRIIIKYVLEFDTPESNIGDVYNNNCSIKLQCNIVSS